MAVRSPQLYEALRRHCLGAFAYLYRASQDEAPLPFSFEEHAAPGRPALYEYRPRARSYVEDRAEELRRLDDAQFALEELRREPAAAIFAHAHAGEDTTEESALYRTILLPFLAGLAERCGGFEWDDQVFNRGYDEARARDLRRQPRLRCGRAPRRHLLSRAGRPRPPTRSCAWPSPVRSRTTGPRRTACSRPASARSRSGRA